MGLPQVRIPGDVVSTIDTEDGDGDGVRLQGLCEAGDRYSGFVASPNGHSELRMMEYCAPLRIT